MMKLYRFLLESQTLFTGQGKPFILTIVFGKVVFQTLNLVIKQTVGVMRTLAIGSSGSVTLGEAPDRSASESVLAHLSLQPFEPSPCRAHKASHPAHAICPIAS